MPLHDLDLHRREVTVRGKPPVRLSVIDAGRAQEPHAPTLLFVHGFGGYGLQWWQQMLAFAATHRVVAMDLRGHGLSDRPHSSYSVDELVGDLETVVEALDLPPAFTLLGHSFGGALCASYAVRFPDRVERLVLVGTSVDFFALHPGVRLAFKLPVALLEPVRTFFPKQLAAPAHVLRAMYRNGLSKWDGNEVLPRVEQPALVIMGERDEVFDRSAYDAVPDRIRGAQIMKVSVSAHLVHIERPDAVNRALARFIRTPLPTSPVPATDHLLRRRPWLRHYELGVPHTLAYAALPLHRLLEHSAKRHPGRRALVLADRSLTYRDLNRAADRVANALGALGITKGDRVALLLGNSAEHVKAYYGTLKAGAIAASLNPTLGGDELAQQLEEVGATVLILDPRLLTERPWSRPPTGVKHVIMAGGLSGVWPPGATPARVARALGQPQRIAWPGGARLHALEGLLLGAWVAPPRVEVGPADVAVIEYSTGTTGEPKGVMLTHANLVANVLQVRQWLGDLEDGKEVVLCALALWHSYGMTACMNLGVSVAASLVVLPAGAGARDLLRAIARHRPTIFPGVPEMFLGINHHPNVRKYGLKSVRACVSGATPLPLEVQEVFERLTRGKLVEGYGLTEAGPITHINPVYGLRKQGSVGVPLPDTEARIVDPRTGDELPAGEAGELVVRGPQVMRGYWNRPDLTARVLREGWLFTGDAACMDPDGFFRVIGRITEQIAAGPHGVFPRQVEEVLYEHPQVHEAAVTAGSLAGETIIEAHVVLKQGESVAADELIAFCRKHLPEHAVPRRVAIRDSLPKAALGKVVRGRLGGESA